MTKSDTQLFFDAGVDGIRKQLERELEGTFHEHGREIHYLRREVEYYKEYVNKLAHEREGLREHINRMNNPLVEHMRTCMKPLVMTLNRDVAESQLMEINSVKTQLRLCDTYIVGLTNERNNLRSELDANASAYDKELKALISKNDVNINTFRCAEADLRDNLKAEETISRNMGEQLGRLLGEKAKLLADLCKLSEQKKRERISLEEQINVAKHAIIATAEENAELTECLKIANDLSGEQRKKCDKYAAYITSLRQQIRIALDNSADRPAQSASTETVD